MQSSNSDCCDCDCGDCDCDCCECDCSACDCNCCDCTCCCCSCDGCGECWACAPCETEFWWWWCCFCYKQRRRPAVRNESTASSVSVSVSVSAAHVVNVETDIAAIDIVIDNDATPRAHPLQQTMAPCHLRDDLVKKHAHARERPLQYIHNI
jgi:hypothetical protein